MGEESQEICKAFRKKGHNAYSCDTKICSGGHPEWHLQMDMWEAFNNGVPTATKPYLKSIDDLRWDMAIVHITCTFMCNSSSLRLYKNGKKVNGVDDVRWANMIASTEEFKRALSLPVAKLVVENPVMHGHAKKLIGVEHTQTIQPYEYGHPASKRTCLWLKGVPSLKPTNILKKPERGYWDNQTPSGQNKLGGG